MPRPATKLTPTMRRKAERIRDIWWEGVLAGNDVCPNDPDGIIWSPFDRYSEEAVLLGFYNQVVHGVDPSDD